MFPKGFNTLRLHGVRRLAVVDHAGGLTVVVSVDDLIQLPVEEMTELGRLISKEQSREIGLNGGRAAWYSIQDAKLIQPGRSR
jgi:hypothetical protein